ncbi:hypothetical protein [Rhodoferax sp. BAB1]|uniref:hypothetical protein n=1 Tax=Rhodoferax sp. BAB1 TaxID=2741720 RepID=UPI0015763F73|nr:hypothetical protein [Rhodoferax sp. BAB1]QKO20905.1 hypothetical protein HTY51_02930 [Rhodoferax sp. BAB1]
MTIQSTAMKLLRWAHEQSLLRPDAYSPGDGFGSPEFDPPIGLTSLGILRQKQIRFVGVHEAAGRIVVYLSKATPSEKVLKTLPKTADGFALQFRQGNPETVSPAHVAEATNTCSMHMTANGAHYTCGSSVSVGNAAVAGTLSCLLRDPITGDVYGLSNNHVTGGCNYAPVGLPIVAPGIMDVTPSNPVPFTVGTHTRQLTMHMGDPTQVDAMANRDAAIFKIRDLSKISSMQQNHYDTPLGSLPLVAGMKVEKVGRSSERTEGVVQSKCVGPLPVTYSATQYNFSGSVYFEPIFVVHGIGDRFSEGGDSGALVTHVDANGVRHAVGIVVAGCADSSAPGQKISLIAPIQPILNEFGLTLVCNHNV